MTVETSNRISVFDCVLGFPVPDKGAVLNAQTLAWKRRLAPMIPNDLVAYGAGIDEYLPTKYRNNPDLQARVVIVRQLDVTPVECVVRGFFTGSAVETAKYGHGCTNVYGHLIPARLKPYDQLPFPIFTPTTKAASGHDEPMTPEEVAYKYGASLERSSLAIYQAMAGWSYERQMLFPDTKFEFGTHRGRLVLVDEVGTADSSRYWDHGDYLEGVKTKPAKVPDLSKELVRGLAREAGIKALTDVGDFAAAQKIVLPKDQIAQITAIYRYAIFRQLGMKLEKFQRDVMGIDVSLPTVRVDVVLGSESDEQQALAGLRYLASCGVVRLNIISCHRNPDTLRNYARTVKDVDVIIAGAGMAAALPGILRSWLGHFGKRIPVIGVAFEGKTYEDDWAAKLSIERLPGKPVEMDKSGHAYFGRKGFKQACEAAVTHEFLPPSFKTKPAILDKQIAV